MDSKNPAPEGPQTPGFGIARDLRQLKTHGAASVAELREFLAQARGRRPEEVLGMLAGSRLLWNVGAATVGVLAILVVGTLVPWWLGGPPAGAAPAAKAAAALKAVAASAAQAKPSGQSPAAQPAQTSAPSSAAAVATAGDAKPSPADAEKAVKAMGLGDTKTADPKKNPMEKSLDKLLDKLE